MILCYSCIVNNDVRILDRRDIVNEIGSHYITFSLGGMSFEYDEEKIARI